MSNKEMTVNRREAVKSVAVDGSEFWTGNSYLLMALLVGGLGLFSLFFGELIPAGGGVGYDGVRYADMVRSLDKMISEGSLSTYYARRTLPSAVVRTMLKFSDSQINDTHIIRGFELYNVALLMGVCWAWHRLAVHFSMSLGGRWIGFCGLFLSYQGSKQTFYDPVLTDVTALLVGILLLLFYVERRPLALLATAILGAFAWPVVTSICGAMLLLFLKADIPEHAVATSPLLESAKWVRAAKLGWMTLFVASVSGFGALGVLRFFAGAARSRTWHLEGLQVALTGLPSLVGAGFALVVLAGSVPFVRAVVASLHKTTMLSAALPLMALFVPWAIVRAIASPTLAPPVGLVVALRQLVLPPWGKFLMPVVSLTVFWGPTVLLLLLNWRAFCVQCRKMGPGVVAVVGMSLPLGLSGEPRQLTLAWPFFVCGAVCAIERMHKGASFKYVYPILAILFGQFWMKFNLAPWPTGNENASGFEFPQQIFFMHYGLSMGWWAYFIQSGVVGLCIVWLRRNVRSTTRGASLEHVAF